MGAEKIFDNKDSSLETKGQVSTVGLQMKLELLQRKLWMTAQQPNDTDCSSVDGQCPLSCQDENLSCFLIDNNGFILVSKVSKQIGTFFGEVDGSVMAQLINMGMFKKVKMFDYQAMCKSSHHHHSGARPLLSPFYALLAAVKWLITDCLLFLLEFNISNFWHTDNFADAKSVFHHAHKHKKHDTLQPCDTEYPVFVYEPSIKETNGIIECGDCQKMFVVQQITRSNLLFLVTDTACDCSIFPPVLLLPKEVKYILLLNKGFAGLYSTVTFQLLSNNRHRLPKGLVSDDWPRKLLGYEASPDG
nr:voltage-dependent calcium channel subunit alpha-2/delta-4-like [Pogona vitticeps]